MAKKSTIPKQEENDTIPVAETKEDQKDEATPVLQESTTTERVTEVDKEPLPLSPEEKIIDFLKVRSMGTFISINEFLKSLYPPAAVNSPKAWHDQRAMKLLKIMIEKLVKDGIVVVEGNFHQRLGRPYDPDGTPGVTHYHNLDTLILKAKLA